ncbi:hypothetical protein DID78_00450 [Candidatus Marinamargulisbacteria bacterium SCGC AG-343-D04]|nr:hypothetical protein DID78_00450 [Candidatus Marinamargulisbacteria bacterium SCGC AG-343-D04]
MISIICVLCLIVQISRKLFSENGEIYEEMILYIKNIKELFMNLIYKNDPSFDDLFESIQITFSNMTYAYTTLIQNYFSIYSNIKENLSFIIEIDNKPVAFCPLFLEINNSQNMFTLSQSFLPAPLFFPGLGQKIMNKVTTLLMATIDELAFRYDVTKHCVRIDPLLDYDGVSSNWLLKYGYLGTSIHTQILDLRKPLSDIFSKVSKGHKSDIKKAQKHFSVYVWDRTNADFECFENYRKLHHKAAGKVTRPLETFSLQFEGIKQDKAILVGIKYKEDWIAYSYFSHVNNCIYYGSASDDPDFSELPASCGHLQLWTAIEYYHQRGFHFLETGWQHYGPQLLDYPSAKEIHISKFKKGFGGETLPFFRAVKYYSEKAFIEDVDTFKQKQLEFINSTQKDL